MSIERETNFLGEKLNSKKQCQQNSKFVIPQQLREVLKAGLSASYLHNFNQW